MAITKKENHPNIPSHLTLCENQLRSLQRHFKFNPELFQEYYKIINEQSQLGILIIMQITVLLANSLSTTCPIMEWFKNRVKLQE